MKQPNKAPHRTAIPLRSIVAGELGQTRKSAAQTGQIISCPL